MFWINGFPLENANLLKSDNCSDASCVSDVAETNYSPPSLAPLSAAAELEEGSGTATSNIYMFLMTKQIVTSTLVTTFCTS